MSKQHLLVVGAACDITLMLKTYFTLQGYDVTCDSDGTIGWALLQSDTPPDLVILDIEHYGSKSDRATMISLAEMWLELGLFESMPFLFLLVQSEYVTRLGLEKDNYVLMPWSVETLKLRVEKLIGQNKS